VEIDEKNISRAARRKMAQRAKKTAKKRAMSRKRKEKRMKNPAALKASAERMAKNAVVKKLAGGRKYGELSISQRERIDKMLSKKPGLIKKIARKMLPKVKKKEKERLIRVRAKGKGSDKKSVAPSLNEVVDPLTVASVIALTGGAVAITATLAKKLNNYFFGRSVDFKVEKTYELIKKKYPDIFYMIRTQKFSRGKLAKMVRDIEDEIPGLQKKSFMNNITSIINQLMNHHQYQLGNTSNKLDPDRFQNEAVESKHGVLTMKVGDSYPEVSAREVNGKLKAYTFKSSFEAKQHTKKVGGKVYHPTEEGVYYVEFTKLDGPEDSIDESAEYMTMADIKKQWKKDYPGVKFGFKKVRGGGSEWLLVVSPQGTELERYQNIPKLGWLKTIVEVSDEKKEIQSLQYMLDVSQKLSSKSMFFKDRGGKKGYIKMLKHKLKKLGVMTESSDEQEDIKSLQAILDTAMELSANNPYFKGRGSKKEYIKMMQHKLSKLGVHEVINVPISIGDTVLGGKFKNKKIVVKSIGKNEKGDLTINGRPLLKFRTIRQKGLMFKEGSKKNKNKPTTRMDAYKKVRKSTMPKSRPMKSKKTYDRKKLRKGEDY